MPSALAFNSNQSCMIRPPTLRFSCTMNRRNTPSRLCAFQSRVDVVMWKPPKGEKMNPRPVYPTINIPFGPPKTAASQRRSAAKPLTAEGRSGFELRPNLARRVRRAVDIHIQVAGLEAGVLLIGELGACRHHPRAVCTLGQRYDRWTGYARRTHMNVRHRAVDPRSLESAADGFVCRDHDRAGRH